MTTIFKLTLILAGALVVTIGSMIFAIGLQETGRIFAALSRVLFGDTSPITGLDDANSDSEIRFYSAFFIAFGMLLIKSAWDYPNNVAPIPLLAVIFFIGGLGRVVSLMQVGPTHSLFTLLMWVELIAPIAILVLYALTEFTRRRNAE